MFRWSDSFETRIQMAQWVSTATAWSTEQLREKKRTSILLILSNLANALLGKNWVHLEPVTSALNANKNKISVLIYRDY